ncbi:MAG: phage holin family protein [Pirellulales bacterium]
MPSSTDPLFARLAMELKCLAAEARESAVARWRLARLESGAAAREVKRLAVALTLAAVLLLTALPILVSLVAEQLDGRWGLSRTTWLVSFGATLAAAGVAVGGLAWRRFRRDFVGLAETREELQEDALWLGEWLGHAHKAGESPAGDSWTGPYDQDSRNE